MQKFETLTKLKTSNNHLFIFTSTSTYLRFSIALPSSFPHLPVWLAPFFVRSLFVLCSFFVRSLFVLCSFFVRSLFVFCLSARAARTVFCLSARVARTVFCLFACRATTACAAHTIYLSCYDLALFYLLYN